MVNVLWSAGLLVGLMAGPMMPVRAETAAAVPPPDARYKADILVVIAHPDDDTDATNYLSRAVLDEGKRVAVVFSTRGNSGANVVGMEQSKALSDVREMEARRSLAARGITNVWFLHGSDTATQDVLHSLETLGHGEALDETVRLIRLTQPDVIMTWMPAYVAGENHGDHQASGVVATEAFDLAGSPTAFPEQINAPRNRFSIANYGEGLRPWQAKKLYYFSDATHPEFLDGHGPRYLATDASRSRGGTYADINKLAWDLYATQIEGPAAMHTYINMPDVFLLGKSLVTAPVTGDVWAGVTPGPIAYAPPVVQPTPEAHGVTVALGGPWAFYTAFYRAHGLSVLEGLVPPQTAMSANHELWLPLLLENHTGSAAEVELVAEMPAGWSSATKATSYHLEPGAVYPVQLFLTGPAQVKGDAPQRLRWVAKVGGQQVSEAGIEVYPEYNGVPQ